MALVQLALVVAEVRLQNRIDGPARAGHPVAGFGADVVAVLMYTSYGLGSVVLDPATTLAACAATTRDCLRPCRKRAATAASCAKMVAITKLGRVEPRGAHVGTVVHTPAEHGPPVRPAA
jgi:hypothetical protein